MQPVLSPAGDGQSRGSRTSGCSPSSLHQWLMAHGALSSFGTSPSGQSSSFPSAERFQESLGEHRPPRDDIGIILISGIAHECPFRAVSCYLQPNQDVPMCMSHQKGDQATFPGEHHPSAAGGPRLTPSSLDAVGQVKVSSWLCRAACHRKWHWLSHPLHRADVTLLYMTHPWHCWCQARISPKED